MENYRIYGREPRWFIRILLIIITIFTLVFPIFILFGIILLLILSKDFRKGKSYIEFTSSDVIIDDYQWWFLWTKHIRLEIPYDMISECKCFSYGWWRTQSWPCFNFNIYLKDWFDISIFSVGKLSWYNRNIAMSSVEEPNCHNIDEEYIKQLFESKNIKICMPKKGLFNF